MWKRLLQKMLATGVRDDDSFNNIKCYSDLELQAVQSILSLTLDRSIVTHSFIQTRL